MALTLQQSDELNNFIHKSNYLTKGAVITDLDGTAVHENSGTTIIHKDVETGLKNVYETGRPVVINTLRFPLSVIRTFAKEWYNISNLPIPVILLNGSQLGFIRQHEEGFIFDQLVAFPLKESEKAKVVNSIEGFKEIINDLVLFYYPEDWTKGETIWTADKNKVPLLQNKYKSAEKVITGSLQDLSGLLNNGSICMILILIESTKDKLMAYQHTRRNNFITSANVNKDYGSREMARLLEFNLDDSVGAGDSEMDVFLNTTGISIHVRNEKLPFKGKYSTLKLDDFHDFGYLLKYLSNPLKNVTYFEEPNK
jgi:hydroxymethylpyrimidine pyrophosphatase-like HAD family hydrolase